MHKNIGKHDRIMRVILGISLLLVTWLEPDVLWGLLGIIPLMTAMTSWCLFYQIFGFSTHIENSSFKGDNKLD